MTAAGVQVPSKRQRLLQALRDAGPRGLLSVAGAAAADMLANNTASLLADFEAEGLAGSWPDPVGPQLKRRRWWAREFYPPRRPPPSNEPMTQHKVPRRGVSKSAAWRRKQAGLVPIQEQAEGLGLRDFGPAHGKGGDVKLKPDAQAIKPAAVAVQRCPGWTHDPRYQVAPGVAVQGAGFAAAGVGRDAITGRPWGAR